MLRAEIARLRAANRALEAGLAEATKARDDLSKFVAASDVAALFLDRNLHVLRHTPRASAIFPRIAADDGRPLPEIDCTVDCRRLAADAADVVANQRPSEHEVLSIDGRYYIVRIQPYRTAQEWIDGAVMTFFDITERRTAEATLRQSEERHRIELERQVGERTAALQASRDLLRATMDASMDMIQVFMAVRDGAGRIVDFTWVLNNHASESKFGEVLGERLLQRNPGVVEEGIFDAFCAVVETGVPHQAERHYVHEQFDGWFLQSVVKLGDGVATTTKDITGWKLAQQEVLRLRDAVTQAKLVESEARYRHLIDFIPAAVYACNADGTLAYYNAHAAALWGRSPALDDRATRLCGALRVYLPDGTELQRERLPITGVLATGEAVVDREVRIARPDGSMIDILVNITALRDASGAISGAINIFQDITRRKQTEQALQNSNLRLHKIVSQTATGLVEADAMGRMTLVNRKFCDMLGYTEAELLGRSVIEITAPDSAAETVEAVQRLASGGADFVLEKRYRCKDGTSLWAESSVCALRGPDGDYQGLVAIVIDISDRKLAEERIRHASLHDALTDLPNRAMLFEYATHQLSHHRRHQRSAALLFLDLDRFKPINDTHGHEIGDEVLKDVAGRLSASLRSDDLVVRLGGDEFVILLQDIGDARYAADVARHIITLFGDPFPVGELTLSLSVSIGVAVFPRDGEDIDALISHADMAMYQAKQNGRNNFQFFSSEYAAVAQKQAAIEQQLKRAVSGERFHLCYQPIVDLDSGRVVSAEALLRWRDSDIGPERFIPVAEATGLINPIGRWLLHEAARQYRRWLASGLPPVPISVNVSVVEFRDPDFATRFLQALDEEGLDPSALQLEVTETAVMEDIRHTAAMLNELKQSGIKILLDDFGTGYSSLAYLVRLPLNKIKIDRSFIGPASDDRASRAVTKAMIALGRTLDLEVVAEGVESESALDFLRGQGCRQAQGFLLGQPMAGERFQDWYLRGRHH